LKITETLQNKLEDIFRKLSYKVRYERGNFKSGYCIIDHQSVIVINKFFSLESKVNAMIEILREIKADFTLLDSSQTKLADQLRQMDPEELK
jgi:hypothetical protein